MNLSSFKSSASSILLLLLFCMTTITVSASTPESVDVVVVGAGLSGLTAARDLLKSGKSVVVLEARDRVGGKVFNQPLRNGGVTEVGAEFVGPTQDKILSLISELGLETFPTYNEGNSLLWRNGTRTVYQSDPQLGGAPPVEQSSLLEIAAAQAQLDAWAAQINTSTPWKHPKAREWDGQTFEDCLIRSISHADAKLVLTTACKAIFSAEPHELSLLYIIAYIAAAGNESTVGTLGRLTAVENGAQEQRVKGGTGLIPQRLAEKVGLKHITLNAAVSRISKTYEGYTIISRAGNIHAKHVVLAMSPPLLRQIVFEPPLPSDRQWLNEKIFMPALGKGIAIYDTPFWRKNANLNAQVISDSGSVRVTFDSTPDDASFGAILGFILGDEMRAVDGNSPAQGQTKILSDYTNYFGTKAANTSEFVLYRWDLEEWSKGGPTGVAPPNVLSLYGTALRQNIDGLHFAGTETSLFWTGYMDGAVRSGQRVAQEILAQ